MIKINLLGKKKSAIPPQLAFLYQLEKIGINAEIVESLKWTLLRFLVLIIGLYAVAYVPEELLRREIAVLDAKLGVLSQRKVQLAADLAQKKDLRKKMESINKDEADLQRQLSAITALTKDRVIAFKTLENVTALLPEKVWLKSINLTKENRMNLSGSSWEHSPINDFVRAVTDTTQFTDVQFRGITSEGGSTVPGISAAAQKIKVFDLDFRIKGPGES